MNNSVSLFYITFVIFQPISAGIGKRVGPVYWYTRWRCSGIDLRMSFIMLCWAAFTIAHAWVKTEGMLIAFRLMIGLFEAGFYPTACFYLSTFYTRYDLAIRIGLFYGMYAIAGAFSSAIAYGIFHIHGALYGWQYLFIIGNRPQFLSNKKRVLSLALSHWFVYYGFLVDRVRPSFLKRQRELMRRIGCKLILSYPRVQKLPGET